MMKTISVAEILDTLMQDFADAWFIGQRKWSCALARQVLDLEQKLRVANTKQTESHKDCGLVFIPSITEVDESLIRDCDRLYVFDSGKQLSVIQIESGCFISTINHQLKGESELKPVQIERTDPMGNRYGFANLIGSIPDLKKYPIKVYVNPADDTWRFSNEK
ncbi:MAG: hypothetical protein PHU99_09435 [Candidatus Cloacimonetes bacterium]|nr:hypothetical protein [Candidatus Cloacimonadota bacterium]